MKQAGVNFVLTCMEVQGNINMARAIQQYGLKTSQLWLNGNDQSTLDQNESLMQGVYFYTAHVPFTAPTSSYPGLKLYLSEMNKYQPQYTLDELAIQGWESAALFVAGVKAAGQNLTQANVIAQTNKLTSFTAGGLTVPVNWKATGHTGHAPPYCGAFIQIKGNKFVPRSTKERACSTASDRSTEERTGEAVAIRDSERHIAGPGRPRGPIAGDRCPSMRSTRVARRNPPVEHSAFRSPDPSRPARRNYLLSVALIREASTISACKTCSQLKFPCRRPCRIQ